MTARLATTDPVLLDFAAEVGASGPVAIEGARTRWAAGGALTADTRLLAAPTGIVDYVPDEMTVTVRCGTSVAELHQALAEKGQRTGLPERGGTVGGALAVGENSLHQLGRGRVREAALQVRYVSNDGKIVTGGGPTVKNVTGFDLPRLMVGSLGTLGLLAEVILRTNPIPACTRWLASDSINPFEVLGVVLRPAAVLWDGTTTYVELEGYPAAVEAEQARLSTLGELAQVDGPPDLPEHRWSLSPAALRDLSVAEPWVASIGVGTVWASTPQPERTPDPVVTELARRLKTQFDPEGRLNPGRFPGSN